jgi:hypothetical protein
MTVYQRVLDLGDGGVELLEQLLGGDADNLLTILSGRRHKPQVMTPTRR